MWSYLLSLQQGLTTIEKVASVATELGSDRLMSTAPKGGTNLQKFVDGLSGFFFSLPAIIFLESWNSLGILL